MRKLLLFLLLFCGFAAAQNAVVMPACEIPFFTNTGAIDSNGFVYTYQSGTFTNAPSFTDYTGSVTNTNPVQLNAAGFPTNAGAAQVCIWLQPFIAYRIVVQNAAHVQQYQIDGIGGTNGSILLAANQVAVTVNANTSATQTLHTYTFGAQQINAVGKTFHFDSLDVLNVVNNTETIALGVTINGSPPGATAAITLNGASIGSVVGHLHGWCQVLTSGAAGTLRCYMAFSSVSAPTVDPFLGVTTTPISGIDLTSPVVLNEVVSFTTASASNLAISESWPLWQDN